MRGSAVTDGDVFVKIDGIEEVSNGKVDALQGGKSANG
jgi:hypothetical protein